jgi:hypothetical protein
MLVGPLISSMAWIDPSKPGAMGGCPVYTLLCWSACSANQTTV